MRLLLLISAALVLIALAGAWLDPAAASMRPTALVAWLILAGGVVYRMRGFALSPSTHLATGVLLAYIALTLPTRATSTASDWIAALACAIVLPAFDAAARTFRCAALRFDASIVLWFGLSLALLAAATLNVVQRGLWLEASPASAGLLAAWIAAGGSLLLRRSRMRAMLIFVSACTLVAQAWHVFI